MYTDNIKGIGYIVNIKKKPPSSKTKNVQTQSLFFKKTIGVTLNFKIK